MRIELKDFQEDAVRQLAEQVELSRQEVERGRPQAVVVSSPTGSGKTVILTALMERIWAGNESIVADPEAIFLWMSDSPELNIQSYHKIRAASDVFRKEQLIILGNDFDREKLAAGRVYFLNTQKLSQASLLTKHGDNRTWTIWQIVENTCKVARGHLYLIVDEAHRGMSLNPKAERQVLTIIQRFILGAPELGLSPVPMVVGMSATTARFQKVLEGAQRTIRPLEISPEDVRESGLLKDRIVLDIAAGDQPADWTLLRDAAKKTQQYSEAWKSYCEAQKISPFVEPVLVVQVEDGTGKVLTRTNLDQAVRVLEKVFGNFEEGELAHCFQEDEEIPAGGHTICKVDASRIQDERKIKVVFFKTALSTGWDCPRAETMMSFRRAKDHTYIAQLVGRMVRTPLARRIEAEDFLGSVALFLPHYDEEGLNAIVARLQDPDTGWPVKIERKRDLVLLRRAPDKADLLKALEEVPTYVLDNTRRQSNTRRLMKLARCLTFDGISPEAWPSAKTLVYDVLAHEVARLRQIPDFVATVSGKSTINVKEFKVELGELLELKSPRTIAVEVTPENIGDLFAQCENVLAEGIKDDYWRRAHDHDEPNQARLELFCALQDPATVRAVQEKCGRRIDELFERYRDEIEGLVSSRREVYARIGRQGAEPRAERIHAPEMLEVQRERPLWGGHLFHDPKKQFGWRANQWETQLLRDEMRSKTLAGWLRNFPKKPWALCVPYGHGEPKPMYPDLLIFRREGGKVRIDILDPHDDSRQDAAEKAVGLANYARKHGAAFGRIEIVRVVQGRVERLNLKTEMIRDKVSKVSDLRHLQELYATLGS